jgi:hypothetical protein
LSLQLKLFRHLISKNSGQDFWDAEPSALPAAVSLYDRRRCARGPAITLGRASVKLRLAVALDQLGVLGGDGAHFANKRLEAPEAGRADSVTHGCVDALLHLLNVPELLG